MVKKILLISLSVIMAIMLFAVDMKTDNMDKPDIKSNWYNSDVITDGILGVPLILFSEDFEGGACLLAGRLFQEAVLFSGVLFHHHPI